MAERARLPPEVVEGLSGHSARVGAAQDMVAVGIELPAIQQAGRWKSSAMVSRYGERAARAAKRRGAARADAESRCVSARFGYATSVASMVVGEAQAQGWGRIVSLAAYLEGDA